MGREFTEATRIKRNSRAVWRAFEHETAIILPESSAVRTLNEVAARCWELADGRTFGELLDVLANEFEVSRTQLDADLRTFFAELDTRNLLERLDE